MVKIILISGKAGSGKTFLANHLKSYIEEAYGKKGYVINFGDALKMVATQIYNWDGEKDETGRELLQRVGTDIAQKNNNMVWVNIVIQIIKAFRSEYDFVIIGDIRFRHEIYGIYDYSVDQSSCQQSDSVYHINIIGPENNLSNRAKCHPSEEEVDMIKDYNCDYLFHNEHYNIYRFFHQISEIVSNVIGL